MYSPEGNHKEKQVVVFSLKGQNYGINIASVREIIKMEQVTRIPGTPDFIEGVINLRGAVVPVMDICKRFSLENEEVTGDARIVILEAGGPLMGIVVGAVSEVLRFPVNELQPPPGLIAGLSVDAFSGIVLVKNKPIILLDVKKILYDHEKRELKEMNERAPGQKNRG